ncbi:glycosyl hydrolase [Marinicellulosiphila megalodicopiae]|uniref:glycosyl hydrolase n=1 Tax=Marinicellulosiphila megalodicopiae TaxID=2724896 RepID=UPI003BAE53F4
MKKFHLTVFSVLQMLLASCIVDPNANTNTQTETTTQSMTQTETATQSMTQTETMTDSNTDTKTDTQVTMDIIPNATSEGRPYCRNAESDPDGDGWGWENSASCIMYQGNSDPGVGNFDYCVVGEVQTTLCAADNGSWGLENNNICLSQSMCPGMGNDIQTPIRVDLVNPNANNKTQQVYDYLRSQWGNHMLSGIMDLTWDDSVDMEQRVINDTGKSPAIMGYDFMNYGIDNQFLGGLQQTEEAIAFWNKGGLISLTWHWRDPNVSGQTIGEFYTQTDSKPEGTAFEIPISNNQLDVNSSDFANIINDIDLIAGELQKLETANVPVLWRPLHEASGGWFWWGTANRTDDVPPAYAQILMWRYLYDRLTNHHGLNNLIWQWNGQSAAWYPGDEYVDITSYDVYATAQDYSSQISIYNETKMSSQEVKMVAMSENSNIPDPDNMQADNAWWLYFLVWNDGYLSEGEGISHENNFWTGEHYNTNAHKQHIYNHDLVITLDELPNF